MRALKKLFLLRSNLGNPLLTTLKPLQLLLLLQLSLFQLLQLQYLTLTSFVSFVVHLDILETSVGSWKLLKLMHEQKLHSAGKTVLRIDLGDAEEAEVEVGDPTTQIKRRRTVLLLSLLEMQVSLCLTPLTPCHLSKSTPVLTGLQILAPRLI
jgi:hypothetical protein